jgi:hypothetical protein
MKLVARAWHLGVFRVCVVLVTLISPEPEMATAIARAPAALRFYPPGMMALARSIPITAAWTDSARWLFYVSGVLALFGLYTRVSLTAFALGTLYLFGVAQLTGEVVHDMHLVWMLALLAASPSGDGFSIDSVFVGRGLLGPKKRKSAYDLALGFARFLLGIVYFFPGFWKLQTSGMDWITSANVVHQMHWKWAQWGGYLPSIRIDRVPWLVSLGAFCVVGFELGFGVVSLFPRARRPLAFCGFVFHQLTRVFFLITFTSLWAMYACLVLPAWKASSRGPRGRALTRSSWPVVVVGGGLVLGAFLQGLRGQTQSYPFACYPTFAHMVADEMPDIGLEAITDEQKVLLPGPRRSQSEWGMAWQVAGLFGVPASREAVRTFAFADLGHLGAPAGTREIRVWLVYRAVEPNVARTRAVREIARFAVSDLAPHP